MLKIFLSFVALSLGILPRELPVRLIKSQSPVSVLVRDIITPQPTPLKNINQAKTMNPIGATVSPTPVIPESGMNDIGSGYKICKTDDKKCYPTMTIEPTKFIKPSISSMPPKDDFPIPIVEPTCYTSRFCELFPFKCAQMQRVVYCEDLPPEEIPKPPVTREGSVLTPVTTQLLPDGNPIIGCSDGKCHGPVKDPLLPPPGFYN